MSTRHRWLCIAALLGLLGVSVVLAVELAPRGSSIAPWWPAAGLSAAVLLLTPRDRSRLALVLIALAASAGNAITERPLDVAVVLGAAHAWEAWVLVALLRLRRDGPQLRATTDILRFLGAVLAAAATAGVWIAASLWAQMEADFVATWRSVTAAHGASLLLVTPLFLSSTTRRRPRTDAAPGPMGRWTPQWRACCYLAALAPPLAFAATFAIGQDQHLRLLPIPTLVWAAMLLSGRATAAVVLLVGAEVTVLTARGWGPMNSGPLDPLTVGTQSQLYLMVLVCVTLPLSLAVEQREAALHEARGALDSFRSLLDATTANAIIGTDPDGFITFFNVGAERMLGWSASDVIGGRPSDFYLDPAEVLEHAPDAEPHPALRGFLTRQGDRIAAVGTDRPWRRHDGSTLVVSAAVTTIRSATGSVEGFLTVAADVTQRLDAKQRLHASLVREQASVAELERVDQLKTEFVSAVSHELRTPLTTILGNTQLLAARIPGPLTDDQEQTVERLHRNGRRLLMLIEDLLTLTSLESRAAARQDEVRAGDVVSAVAGQAADLVGGRDLQVRVEDRAADAVLRADADELERALVNLVGNAVKFTPDGGRVSLTSRVEGEVLVWVVADTGIGVPAPEVERLFERFFRSSTVVSLAIQGTGLGLSIVRTIAEAHGGSVRWRPQEGPGSTFELRLPLATTRTIPTSPEVTPVEVA